MVITTLDTTSPPRAAIVEAFCDRSLASTAALLDALALSRALESNGSLADALNAYVCMRYWHIRTFQWASAMFTPFYQSDGHVLAFVRDWLAGPLSNLSLGQKMLVRLVSGMTVAPLAGTHFAPLRLGLPQE